VAVVAIAGAGPACTSDCDDVGCAGRFVLAFDVLPDGPTTTVCIDDVCGEVATERIADASRTAVALERGSGLDRGPDTDMAALAVGGGVVESLLPSGYRPADVTVHSSWHGAEFTARAALSPEIVGRTSCDDVPCYGADLTLDAASGELRQVTAEDTTR
jgi:hypothetical protein